MRQLCTIIKQVSFSIGDIITFSRHTREHFAKLWNAQFLNLSEMFTFFGNLCKAKFEAN